VDRVGLSEVRGQGIAGVSRTGLSSQAALGGDDSVSSFFFYYLTIRDSLEHPIERQSMTHMCRPLRPIRH